MSATVDQHFVQQFTDGITHLAQQKMSRLRGAVSVDPSVVGDRAYYDQLNATTMSKRTSRHGDTEYTDTPHTRRMVTLESWDVADLVDSDDKVQVLNDPTNAYTQAFAMAAGRTMDDVILEAFAATAATGQTGTGTEPFPADREVAVVAGPLNLQIEQVIEAKRRLDQAEVPEDDRFFYTSASGIESLLNQNEVKSIDYNSVRALVAGQVNTLLGFTFIRGERGAIDGNDVRDSFAWQRDSMKLAIGINPRGEIDRLPTKRYSTQVFYEMRIGATRMDPYGVVRVKHDET